MSYVLLAGAAVCCKELLQVLRDDHDVFRCDTLDEAAERLKHESPDVIVLCYLFDEMRPFRLIHHVRNDLRRRDLPILLVQPVDWNLDDAQTRQMTDAYESIGINGFVDLCEDVKASGDEEPLQRFRTLVSRLLSSKSQ